MPARELVWRALGLLEAARGVGSWNDANRVVRALVDDVEDPEDVRELAVTVALLVGATELGAAPVDDRLERLGLEFAWMWSP